MRRGYWHQYQILTKRAEYLCYISGEIEWPENVWMGVSVENHNYVQRIDFLRQTDAKIKFLSLEPLLGPLLNLNLEKIDWVIVGGESGSKARPIKQSWVVNIRNQCIKAKVPFFFKQWGGYNRKRAGRILLGRTWDEMPVQISLRELPRVNTASDCSQFQLQRLSSAISSNSVQDPQLPPANPRGRSVGRKIPSAAS
jgi:protein gp37